MDIEPRFGICALAAWAALLYPAGAYADENEVRMIVDHEQRCFISNGLPDHETGTFPNEHNPNGIKPQSIRKCVPGRPPWTPGTVPQYLRGPIGIAINGITFRPYTAEYYDATSRRGFSKNPASGWSLDGLGARHLLGIDENSAHVDEQGQYHYHGLSDALIDSTRATLIGYAADGYDIHFVDGRKKSSYQLKPGNRPTAPFGPHDGTYNEDWQYIPGSGDLDECNGGRNLYGRFVYYATETYPFLPRCLWGEISEDFKRPGDVLRSGGQPPQQR